MTANTFFDASTVPFVGHTSARAEAVTAFTQAVETSFGLLPDKLVIQQGRSTNADDTGTTNAYAIALNRTLASYTRLLLVSFVPGNTNSGPSTLNVDGKGAVSVRKFDGSALTGGEIIAGVLTMAWYDDTGPYFKIVNPMISVGSVTVNNKAKATLTDTLPAELDTKIQGVGAIKERVTAATGDARFQLKLGFETEVSAHSTVQIGGISMVTTAGLDLCLPAAGSGDTALQDGDVVALVDYSGALDTSNATITGNAGNINCMGLGSAATLTWDVPYSMLIAKWNAGSGIWKINGFD